MALVMLPCELPWWPQVQRFLSQLQDGAKNSVESLVRVLTSVHALCNVGLDPDEPETVDLEQFSGLAAFLQTQCDETERQQVLTCAIPCMVQYALRLKELKPPGGLHFSLQQQADSVALDKRLAAALLAHAFFSSFPKRSLKTHPTLLDFNFSHFFKHLHLASQQAKFRSLMQYYCLLSKSEPQGCLKISRRVSLSQPVPAMLTHAAVGAQVLTSARWLTVEDWLESCLPLCPVLVRHQPRPECAPEPAAVILAPCAPHVGQGVLAEDFSPQCRLLAAQPETLAILLFVEALEDNETLLLEGASQSSRINPLIPHFESLTTGSWVNCSQLLSFADPEDFTALPPRQYEEDNVLRELNKLLLAFEPSKIAQISKPPSTQATPSSKRLSPIGESFSSTPPESIISSFVSNTKKSLLRVSSSERAGRFIALGSSGELLPISRNDLPMNHPRFTVPRHSLIGKQPEDVVLPVPPSLPGKARSHSEHSSKRTSSSLRDSSEEEEDDDEFHSAKESLDLSEDGPGPYGHQLDTPQRRCSFAQRLREALRREASALGVIDPLAKEKFASLSSSSSSEADGSSYAVGISVSGSDVIDRKYKVRRGGSCGFALPEDQDLRLGRKEMDPLGLAPAKWLGRALSKDSDSNDDSNVSQHNSEYSSDLEELYEHFSRWLEHDKEGEEQAQEEAVRNFARGLLTRTLSDCGLIKSTAVTGKGSQGVTRSLSEAAGSAQSRSNAPRRLAAHLASLLGDGTAGPRPVATGSWWGGHNSTDPQLKAVLQWLAASQAQSSCLLYYTDGVNTLAKLDTLCRVIVDRQWSVGELTSAVLRFAQTSLDLEDPNLPAPTTKRSLFDELIGTDKPVVTLETEL